MHTLGSGDHRFQLRIPRRLSEQAGRGQFPNLGSDRKQDLIGDVDKPHHQRVQGTLLALIKPGQQLDIDRVAKLLALLSSDNDGERHNAADALGRLFRASGTDFVAVAQTMLAPPNKPRGLLDMMDALQQGFARTREASKYWTAAEMAVIGSAMPLRTPRNIKKRSRPIKRRLTPCVKRPPATMRGP